MYLHTHTQERTSHRQRVLEHANNHFNDNLLPLFLAALSASSATAGGHATTAPTLLPTALQMYLSLRYHKGKHPHAPTDNWLTAQAVSMTDGTDTASVSANMAPAWYRLSRRGPDAASTSAPAAPPAEGGSPHAPMPSDVTHLAATIIAQLSGNIAAVQAAAASCAHALVQCYGVSVTQAAPSFSAYAAQTLTSANHALTLSPMTMW